MVGGGRGGAKGQTQSSLDAFALNTQRVCRAQITLLVSRRGVSVSCVCWCFCQCDTKLASKPRLAKTKRSQQKVLASGNISRMKRKEEDEAHRSSCPPR